MDLRNNLHNKILRKCRHLWPVLNIGTKLDLYRRISYTLAVKNTIFINSLIKEIFLTCISSGIFLSRSKESLISSCSSYRAGIHKCHRRNLAILDLRAFTVREISGGMTNAERIVCRCVTSPKARSAESSLNYSTCFQQISQNTIFCQFHINWSTCRINT